MLKCLKWVPSECKRFKSGTNLIEPGFEVRRQFHRARPQASKGTRGNRAMRSGEPLSPPIAAALVAPILSTARRNGSASRCAYLAVIAGTILPLGELEDHYQY